MELIDEILENNDKILKNNAELIAVNKEWSKLTKKLLDELAKARKDVPSVQLGTNLAEVGTDCISRQAAIDAVNSYFGFNIEEEYGSAVQEVINKLPSAQPEPHWIPVTERLPEESGQYLITVKYEHVDGYEDIYAEHGDWSDGKWDMFGFGHCGKVEDIVAWMPLPEPYKGETE